MARRYANASDDRVRILHDTRRSRPRGLGAGVDDASVGLQLDRAPGEGRTQTKSRLNDGRQARERVNQVGQRRQPKLKGETTMLWTIFVILLIMWLLGMVSSYTLGGFIHLLLLLALVVLIYQLLTGRRVAT